MKRGEHKRLSKLLEKSDLTPKQMWRIRDFISDVDDRAFREGYSYAIDVLNRKGIATCDRVA